MIFFSPCNPTIRLAFVNLLIPWITMDDSFEVLLNLSNLNVETFSAFNGNRKLEISSLEGNRFYGNIYVYLFFPLFILRKIKRSSVVEWTFSLLWNSILKFSNHYKWYAFFPLISICIFACSYLKMHCIFLKQSCLIILLWKLILKFGNHYK